MTSTDELIAALQAAAGPSQVRTALDERTFFSTDISRRGDAAEAVVAIADSAVLATVLRLCHQAGRIVLPRGGGFSYTGGYVPVDARSVIIDLRGMNRIVEINSTDMYVEVEAGCTWERLYAALKQQGLRTPYFGPMSGFNATVGGALSQGSFFLGSTQHGVAAESVLALELALADGTLVKTGSWAATNGCGPFLRNYGPDLTGLFLSDSGALGFKTRVVLKLIPFPPHQQYGSYAFDNEAEPIKAMSAIGRAGLTAECYCWDPYFVKVIAATSTGLAEDLKFLSGVASGGGSRLKGLANVARIALAGKKVFSGDIFILNVTIDDISAAGAAARLDAVAALVAAQHGRPITASAPMAMRGTPFTDFNVPERRLARRNLPVNSMSPHSKVGAVSADVRSLLNTNQALMEQHGISCGVIYFCVGAQAMCCEPLLYWNDEEHFQHNRLSERSDLAALAAYQERPPATLAVAELRRQLAALFERHGCAHMQIGKAYPYLRTRAPATATLLRELKHLLDPQALMNRGALGFGAATDTDTHHD